MFAACLVLALAAIRLVTQKSERRAAGFFAAFLVAFIVFQIPQIIGFAGFYDRDLRWSFYVPSTELWLGPLLYLHAFSLMCQDRIGHRIWALAPGVIQLAYYGAMALILRTPAEVASFRANVHRPFIDPIETIGAIGLALAGLYGVYRLLKGYRHFLRHTESNIDPFDPSWLSSALHWSAAITVLYIVSVIYDQTLSTRAYFDVFPIYLLAALATCWMSLVAISKTQTPFPKLQAALQADDTLADGPVDLAYWREQGQTLLAQLKSETLYLDPKLSRGDLARSLATNETYVSRAISLGLDSNFSTIVNTIRVEHAKVLLARSDQSILSVALESGFNSKATFYRVFKQITGATPRAYRDGLPAQSQTLKQSRIR